MVRREAGWRRYGVEDLHRPSRPLVGRFWTREGARSWIARHTWEEA